MDRAKWEIPKLAVMAIGTVVITVLLVVFAEITT